MFIYARAQSVVSMKFCIWGGHRISLRALCIVLYASVIYSRVATARDLRLCAVWLLDKSAATIITYIG